jgi:putative endonuclease
LGELDLVAEKGDEVVFVEVKTRSSDAFGGALAAVGWTKERRLRAAAYSYLNAKGLQFRPFRIDVVALTVVSPGRARLEHLIGAVSESG